MNFGCRAAVGLYLWVALCACEEPLDTNRPSPVQVEQVVQPLAPEISAGAVSPGSSKLVAGAPVVAAPVEMAEKITAEHLEAVLNRLQEEIEE